MKLVAFFVITLTLLFASCVTAACVHEREPGLIAGIALPTLLYVATIAIEQYRAVFHHRAGAAWASGMMLRIGTTLFAALLSFFLWVTALFGGMLDLWWYVVALGAVSGCAFLFYAANKDMQLHRTLQEQKADDPEQVTSSGFSIKELLLATTVVAIFAGATMGLVRWMG